MINDTLHGLEGIGWTAREDLSAKVRHIEYSLDATWADSINRELVRLNQASEPPTQQ
jgi:hypothetical protein